MCIVLSLFIAYLFFLGCAMGLFRPARGDVLEMSALCLFAGLLVNHALTLLGLELRVLCLLGAALAIIGVVRFIREVRRSAIRFRTASIEWITFVIVAYVLVLYYFQILSEPLFRWDARSVWFFHAKMIWTEGAFRQSIGWNHPSIDFASPDYPNLVPALAAQLASLVGYWNEFMPKGSLVVMLAPLVLWVFSFRRATLAFALLFALYFFSLHAWLWNGYMDAYLSMYCGVALLAFGRYAEEGREVDLSSGVCALGIAATIKNEGLMFAACAIIGVLLVGLRRAPLAAAAFLKRMRSDRAFLGILLIAAAPTLIWAVLKKWWGLQNHVIVAGGLQRVVERLTDGTTAWYLFHFLAARATVSWLLVAFILATAWFARRHGRQLHAGSAIALTVTALYFAGTYAVYLVAPANVTWLLLTSATRVMATVSFGLLVAIFFLLVSLERDGAGVRVN